MTPRGSLIPVDGRQCQHVSWRADYEKTHVNDPTLNLATWRINWLLFFALPPALLAIYAAAKSMA